MTDLMIIMWWMCFIGGIVCGVMFFNVILSSVRASSSSLCLLLSLCFAGGVSAEFSGTDSINLSAILTNAQLRNSKLDTLAGQLTNIDYDTNYMRIYLEDIRNAMNDNNDGVVERASQLSTLITSASSRNLKLDAIKTSIDNLEIEFDDINIVAGIDATNIWLSTISSKINLTNSNIYDNGIKIDLTNTKLDGLDTSLQTLVTSNAAINTNTLAANTLLETISGKLTTLNNNSSSPATLNDSNIVSGLNDISNKLSGLDTLAVARNYSLDELVTLNENAELTRASIKSSTSAIRNNTVYLGMKMGDIYNINNQIKSKIETIVSNSANPNVSTTGPNYPINAFPTSVLDGVENDFVFDSYGANTGTQNNIEKKLNEMPEGFPTFQFNFTEQTVAPVWTFSLPMSQLSVGGFALQDHNFSVDFSWYSSIRTLVHSTVIVLMSFFAVMRVFAEYKNA